MKLKFIGDNGYIHGIPARDLSDEEVETYGEEMLLASGMYEAIEEKDNDKNKDEVNHGIESVKKDTVRS